MRFSLLKNFLPRLHTLQALKKLVGIFLSLIPHTNIIEVTR